MVESLGTDKKRIDIVKDVSIGYISISGLLITLIIAIVAPAAVAGTPIHFWFGLVLGLAIFCLLLTALVSGYILTTLCIILEIPSSRVLLVQFVLFFVSLASLGFAIAILL